MIFHHTDILYKLQEGTWKLANTELINGIHHCTFLNQKLNDLTMALRRRMPQWSMAVDVQTIHAASVRNDQTHHFLVERCGMMRRCTP